MLLTMIFAPTLPVAAKMGVAALTALAGTALFLKILRQIPLRSTLMVPLVGIMLGGVISAVTTFVAYRYDMMQSMGAWMSAISPAYCAVVTSSVDRLCPVRRARRNSTSCRRTGLRSA